MATLTRSTLGIIELFKAAGPNGKGVADLIEMLNDTSQDLLTDFMWTECNKGAEHQHSVRAKLPSVAWGKLYQGVPNSKSDRQSVTDTTGFVEGMSQVDTRLLELAGDKAAAIRKQESMGYVEAMAQELMRAFFYYTNTTHPERPQGMAPRFGALSTTGNGNQIVDAGGVGSDNTSIWFVEWGEMGVQALYPQGTQAGITQTDKGEQRVTDGTGAYFVKEELIKAHLGFAVKDYRRVARVANIDVSELQAGNVDVYAFMRKAYYKLHTRRVSKVRDQSAKGHCVIYANKDVLEALDAINTNQPSGDNFIRLRPMEVEGKEVLSYRGMPIRETDALLNTEARVV